VSEQLETDVLVVGGGAAGLRAALQAAERGRRVILLAKGPISRSGITPLASTGVTASFDPEDSRELHYQDTMRGGRGLADTPLVRALAEDAPEQVRWLASIGQRFSTNANGSFALTIRPGQSQPRNCFAIGGGWSMSRTLLLKTADYPQLRVVQDAYVTSLVVRDGEVRGAICLDLKSGGVIVIQAGATVLATGGYGQLWKVSDCPPDSTGDGAVLALDAGATLVDLEMVQFYPAVGVYPSVIRGLIMVPYEFGINPDLLGGRLLNGKSEQFVQGFPMRDELARAIFCEIEEDRATRHGGVYMDLVHSKYEKEELTRRIRTYIPSQNAHMLKLGIDIAEQMIEVAPAPHFCCGGIRIDDHGATDLPGLFAAGECAGNVQGANRISGNALAETLVFGARAGDAAAEFAGLRPRRTIDTASIARQEEAKIGSMTEPREEAVKPSELKERIQQVIWRACSPKRNGIGLTSAVAAIEGLKAEVDRLTVPDVRRGCYQIQQAYEVRAMVSLAECLLQAALSREESRGAHFREDFPATKEVGVHTATTRAAGGVRVGTLPVLA
jgi:succinate dehydrogenase/fumarate reductase flavoprotein subunit